MDRKVEYSVDQTLALSVLDALPTPIFVKDDKLNFVYANTAHCKLIGKELNQLVGRSDIDFFPEIEARGYLSRDRKILDDGIFDYSEETPTTSDGTQVPVITRKVRLVLGGKQKFLVGTISDQTEIKRREEQDRQLHSLKQQNEDILKLNIALQDKIAQLADAQSELLKKGKLEQLGKLTATVAHELRNPLGAVRTTAFLLERKLGESAPEFAVQFDRIKFGISRCDNIITQLLDFSRTREVDLTPHILDTWLTDVVSEEVKKLPAQLKVELALATKNEIYNFDPARLSRAVINLLSNAYEAMLPRKIDGKTECSNYWRIIIRTFDSDRNFGFSVEDNGPGIPKEILKHIREPLFTTKNFGTGLGVPAVEQIAIQHGGSLEIQSEVGKGAKFTVVIPKSSLNLNKATHM
jgi:PAS domain S-box-containing protein